jgi:hypothetical protein
MNGKLPWKNTPHMYDLLCSCHMPKDQFVLIKSHCYVRFPFSILYVYLPQILDLLFILSGSASPPPLEAASLPRGMVTMRCDITTCSSSHVSLLVSGSAQTCFDDQVHISESL